MLTRLYHKIRAALRKAVHSDKVRPFVWVYYGALWIWGVYGTFFAGPATYIKPAMGDTVYDLWIWLHIIATSIVMGAMLLEDKAPPGNPLLAQTSVRLQTGGHAAMFFVLLAYEISAVADTEWDQGTYSIFVISPYVIGCLLLTAQGIARITGHRGAR